MKSTMVFFLSWLFGSTSSCVATQDDDVDMKESSQTVSFRIAAHDFGKF